MLDKRNQKYFDYLVKLQAAHFTGGLTFNFHTGTIGNAQREIRVMEGVKQKERVKI